MINMWGFSSSSNLGTGRAKKEIRKPSQVPSECSDDDISINNSREEGLECPICWESFNIVENVPYILWCGHTLCKNCVLGLQWAIVKLPTLPIQLPFFVSCPWCNLLSLRLIYKGNLTFPRKNFFLLWMVESMNGDRIQSHSSACNGHQHQHHQQQQIFSPNRNPCPSRQMETSGNNNHMVANFIDNEGEGLHVSLRKCLVFFVHLTAKFPLVFMFLLIVMYAIPASAAVLALYILITILFAVPSFLVLYFAYPCLDWLVREIISL